MATPTTRAVAAPRCRERGAILLVALAMCVTLGLLSIAVLATRDAVVRTRANAGAMRLAEAAAAAGVEWAAARDVARGRIAGTTTLDLGDAGSAVVTIASSSPHVVSVGSHAGARVTLRADLTAVGGGELPFAFASFAGTNHLDHHLTVDGRAHLGGSTPLSGSRELRMYGDLDVVTTSALPAGMVRHFGGATTQGVAAIAEPTVDTTPFASMPASATVLRHSGSVVLKDLDFTGIVVLQLDSGQTATIEDSVIRGAVVATAAPGLLGGGGLLGLGLARPTVRLKGNVRIDGGHAAAGNLALLAAFCTLDAQVSNATVSGVTLAYECQDAKSITFRGQLVLLERIRGSDGDWRVEWPAGFWPDTPLGIRWPLQASARITWLSRQ